MPKICYEPMAFGAKRVEIIDRAAVICQQYNAQGYSLTLRQLYYRFVANGWIENTERSYKNLGSAINDARLAGQLDWLWLTDRTRSAVTPNHWTSPADLMRAAAEGFHHDWWQGQTNHVEVWVEKEALADVIGQVADRWDVSHLACRGYMSQSEQWTAARRMARKMRQDHNVVVLHLGDHDPSGIDMSRDNEDRLLKFIAHDLMAEGWTYLQVRRAFHFERIALTMEQIEQYDPPPNPAKVTDSRFAGYQTEYGDESWELDALPPDVLDALIESHIERWCDIEMLDARKVAERELIERAVRLMDEHGHELDSED